MNIDEHKKGKGNLRFIRNGTMLIIFTGFMFTAFYSVIFACKRLGREGISNIARNQFLKKHSVYVGVFLVVWSI